MSRIVELGVNMRPTARLQAMKFDSITEVLDASDTRSHVGGGELSIRVMRAPPLPNLPPGKWLACVVEQWPSGHHEILGAFHADSGPEAFTAIQPLYDQLTALRRA